MCQLTKVGVVSEPLVHYYNYTGNKQVSSLTQKYKDSFEYINQKHSNLFNKLTDEEKKKKKENELFLLGNKAMRNGDSRTARRYMCGILKINFNLKAIIYILFSFFGFKFILKMRKRKN